MVEVVYTGQSSVLGSVGGGSSIHWSSVCEWWVLCVMEVIYTEQSSVLGSVGSGR